MRVKASGGELPPKVSPSRVCFILASSSPRRRELLEILDLPFIVVPPALSLAGNVPPGQTTGPGGIDETPLPGEAPSTLVQRLSRAKAQAVAAHLPALAPLLPVTAIPPSQTDRLIIIAADTEVVLDGKILGKPGSPAEATHMLKQLRQRSHHVYSGLTLAVPLVADDPLALTGRPGGQLLKLAFQGPTHSHLNLPYSKLLLLTRLHRSVVWMRAYTDAEIAAYVASDDPLDKAGAYGIQHQTFAPVERLAGCFASVMGLPLAELAAALADIDLPLPPIGPHCAQHTGYPCCQAHDELQILR